MIKTRHGFTLIELLMVIALMGIVTTLATKSFVGMLTHWREVKIMADLENSADKVLEEIAVDLSDVLSADISGVSIVGIDDEWSDNKQHKVAPDQSDRIIIPIQGAHYTSDENIAKSIQYALVHGDTMDGNRKSSLIRTTGSGTLGNPNFEEGAITLDVIEDTDTLAFDIEYATDTDWVDEWNESTLPKAIRVGIVVAKRDQPYYQISRKAVFKVAVQ